MHLVGFRVFRRKLLLLLVRVLLRALRAAAVVGVGCAGLVRGLGLRVCGLRVVGRLRRLLLLLDRKRLILNPAIVALSRRRWQRLRVLSRSKAPLSARSYVWVYY